MNIKYTTWFTPASPAGGRPIGIVIVDFEDGEGTQAFIGVGEGNSEKLDAELIARWGAKFPLMIALHQLEVAKGGSR